MDAWPSPPDSQLVAGCARPGWRPECAVGLLDAGVREADGGVSADTGTGLLVGGEPTAPSEPVEPPVAPARAAASRAARSAARRSRRVMGVAVTDCASRWFLERTPMLAPSCPAAAARGWIGRTPRP